MKAARPNGNQESEKLFLIKLIYLKNATSQVKAVMPSEPKRISAGV
jgi:hypothetical protein